VSAELVNKACAYLLTTLTNVINTVIKAYAHLLITLINATKADLFVYNTTAKSRYTFIVFIRIMVNISVFKKFTTGYKQF
jgi:hypothetical protein